MATDVRALATGSQDRRIAGTCPSLSARGSSLGDHSPPAAAGDGAYHIGPGDTLMITVYGQETLAGSCSASAPTEPSAIRSLGERRCRRTHHRRHCQRIGAELGSISRPSDAVSVSITEYAPVFVLGEVEKPGPYPYRPGHDRARALAVGGGLQRPTWLDGQQPSPAHRHRAGAMPTSSFSASLQVRRAPAQGERRTRADDFSFVLPTHDTLQDTDALNRIVEGEKNLFTVRKTYAGEPGPGRCGRSVPAERAGDLDAGAGHHAAQ